MAQQTTQWITHSIDGGWATDYGQTVYASPQQGELRIPWLAKAENVRFYPDGSVGKHPGFSVICGPKTAPSDDVNNIPSSSNVHAIYNYSRNTSSLFGTQYKLAAIGTYLYHASTSNATPIGNIRKLSTYPTHFSTFGDLLIIGNSTAPKSWDGTTFQDLAGTPPNFGASIAHAGRHWAIRNNTSPSRLYYSAVGNPEDWVGAGSGSIDIDPGDGDVINAILSWKKELWVFKGDSKLSIHRITGTSPSDFARTVFITGVSAANCQSIFPVGDDFGFWSPRGSCHTMTNTANYGDYTQAYVNFPILSWCKNVGNIALGSTYSTLWQSITDTTKNITYSLFNNTPFSASYNPEVIVMDWKYRSQDNIYPRFSKLNVDFIYSCGMTPSIYSSGSHEPTFGTRDGRVLQELSEGRHTYTIGTQSTTTTTTYKSELITPALSYGPLHTRKSVMGIGVDIAQTTSFNEVKQQYGTLDIAVGGPQFPTVSNSFTFNNGRGLGTFVLGTDQLDSLKDPFRRIEGIAGESSSFTYTFTENSPYHVNYGLGGNAKIKHFLSNITYSGESLETTQ